MRDREVHRGVRIGWLRAALLGANDGILSTARLVVGVAAAAATRHEILLAGAAGLVAGARSMAAGEDVSVSSHADTEHADQGRASHSRFRACCVLGLAGNGGDRRRRNVIRNDGRLNHRARWH